MKTRRTKKITNSARADIKRSDVSKTKNKTRLKPKEEKKINEKSESSIHCTGKKKKTPHDE